jgi:hypothetical protein
MQRRGLDDIYLVDGSGVSGERSPTLPHVPYSYSPTVPSFKKHKVDDGLAIQKVKTSAFYWTLYHPFKLR